MAYVKNATWNAGAAPGISAAALTNLETEYDEAILSLNQDLARAVVISGGVCTRNGGNLKQLDVTQCVYYALQTADNSFRRRVVNATNFLTVTASTTYFLDFNVDGTTSWGTSHSGTANFVTIASVTTDGSGNINVITDTRPTNFDLFVNAVGRLKWGGSFIPEVGTHSTQVFTLSAGNGAPGSLDTNEIYFQLS